MTIHTYLSTYIHTYIHDQLNREKFPYPRLRLKIWFRETDLAVPSRVSLLLVYTNAEYGAYSRGSSQCPQRCPYIFIYYHTPSGQSRLYRVTRLRTDGVHCRESVVSKHNHCCTAAVHTVDPFPPPDLCPYKRRKFSVHVTISYVVFQNIPVVITAVL